jgi:hypothetical protein
MKKRSVFPAVTKWKLIPKTLQVMIGILLIIIMSGCTTRMAKALGGTTEEGKSKISVYDALSATDPEWGALSLKEKHSVLMLWVKKDGFNSTTVLFLREIAEKGYSVAQYGMGLLYTHGEPKASITKDDREALRWFRKAADQGHPYAALEVGNEYHDAYLKSKARKDLDEAIRWYVVSAKGGLPRGQRYAGVDYIMRAEIQVKENNVEEGSQDLSEGMNWLKKAAENGDKKAKQVLDAYDMK